MTSVMVAGLGDVGVRTARQLLDTPGVEQVFVAARARADAPTPSPRRCTTAPTPWALADDARPAAAGVTAVVSTLPADDDIALGRAAVVGGGRVRDVRRRLGRDRRAARARRRGAVEPGCTS